MKKTGQRMRMAMISALLFAAVFFITAPAHAACTSPTGATGEQIYNTSEKVMQFCNGADWVAMSCGEAQGTSPCTAPEEGEQKYNTTQKVMQFCDGSNWIAMGCYEIDYGTVNAFSFTDNTNAAPSSLITSNIVTITGPITPTPVTISGDGSPQFRINGGTWGTTGAIDNGETLQLRLTSSGSAGATRNANVLVGGVSDAWSVTTTTPDPCAGSPSAGTICADGSIYAGLSPDGNRKMYATATDSSNNSFDDGYVGGDIDVISPACSPVNPPGAESTCWTGESNTTTLATSDSNSVTSGTQYFAAARHCYLLSRHGKSDWYLPALNELHILYNRRNTGGFSGTYTSTTYWSSSDWSGPPMGLNFSNGLTDTRNAHDSLKVRCVRRD